MIITDRFVLVHMHKTGGQFLNEIIARCIPDQRTSGYHLPRAEVPQESTHLPIVGMVRNPWDWYVSWYAFNKRPGINNPLFRVVSNGGTEGFKATVSNLILLSSDRPGSAAHRDTLLRLLPETLDGNRGVGLTRNSIRDLAASGQGYYSWLFDRMLGSGRDEQTFIGRFENLQQDFLAIMERLSVAETHALSREFGQRERKNVSRHSLAQKTGARCVPGGGNRSGHTIDRHACDAVGILSRAAQCQRLPGRPGMRPRKQDLRATVRGRPAGTATAAVTSAAIVVAVPAVGTAAASHQCRHDAQSHQDSQVHKSSRPHANAAV